MAVLGKPNPGCHGEHGILAVMGNTESWLSWETRSPGQSWLSWGTCNLGQSWLSWGTCNPGQSWLSWGIQVSGCEVDNPQTSACKTENNVVFDGSCSRYDFYILCSILTEVFSRAVQNTVLMFPKKEKKCTSNILFSTSPPALTPRPPHPPTPPHPPPPRLSDIHNTYLFMAFPPHHTPISLSCCQI